MNLSNFFILSLSIFLTGCTTRQIKRDFVPPPPKFVPKNVYTPPQIPITLQRVVFLPIYYEENESSFLPRLDDIFRSELTKTSHFEVINPLRSELEQLLGEDRFNPTIALPNDLLSQLENKYSAEGVIFTELTRYHPYKPIVIGVRCKLVEIKTGKILWAFDSLFDAGSPRVAHAAKSFQLKNEQQDYPLEGSDSILQSPSKFSKYVAFEIFQTIP